MSQLEVGPITYVLFFQRSGGTGRTGHVVFMDLYLFMLSVNHESNGKIITMNTGEFCNLNSGLLADEQGKFWKPEDPLHLGSSGIRLLASKIRQCVYSSATTGRSYSSVLRGNASDASRSRLSHHGTAKLGQSSLAPS